MDLRLADVASAAQVKDSYQPGQRQQLESAVRGIQEREASQGPWSARDGMCLDLAAKWQQRLQAEGFEASIVTVDPVDTLSVDGQRVHGKFHAFVAIQGETDLILLDGSVQQFFGGPQQRPDLPEVFVGTMGELTELFQQHRKDLRIEVEGDRLEGRYDATELADFVYGSGRFAGSRTFLH